MSIDIRVLSKLEFNGLMIRNDITDENVEKRDLGFFISINDSDAKSFFNEDHDNVIRLYFDDIENEGEISPTNRGKCKVFDEKMAEELYLFIKKHRDKKFCIVHCEAGISRSSACGTFINGYCRGDWEEFKRRNPFMVPNARVVRMLNQSRRNDSNSE